MSPVPFHVIDGGPCSSLAEAAVHARRPFMADVVKARIWDQTDTGADVAFYVDARIVIDRLNVLMPGRWRADLDVIDQRPGDGRGLIVYRCRLTVADGVFVDAGEGHDHKSARSDALKRAAVHLGIGHCLYRIPRLVMPAGPGRDQLRGEPGAFALDAANEAWLRRYYRRWLIETGVAEYGLPLDHGRAARSVAPELYPDDVRALLASRRRRRRGAGGDRPVDPAPAAAASVIAPPADAVATQPSSTPVSSDEPDPSGAPVTPTDPTAHHTSTAAVESANPDDSPVVAATASAAANGSVEPTEPPDREPSASEPHATGEKPEPPTVSPDQLALSPAPPAPSRATSEPTAPPAPADPGASTASKAQLAALITTATEHGYANVTLAELVGCVAGCRLDELTARGLHAVRSFLDSAVAAAVEDGDLRGALATIKEEPVYGTAPRDRLATWLLHREERAAA